MNHNFPSLGKLSPTSFGVCTSPPLFVMASSPPKSSISNDDKASPSQMIYPSKKGSDAEFPADPTSFCRHTAQTAQTAQPSQNAHIQDMENKGEEDQMVTCDDTDVTCMNYNFDENPEHRNIGIEMTFERTSPCTKPSCPDEEEINRIQNVARRHKRRELLRKQKDRFFVFTRVLVKYLEQTDMDLHNEVRDIIQDCSDRKSRNEPGYESVTTALSRRIREVVSDVCWNRAEVYLEQFLREKDLSNKAKSASPSVHHSRSKHMRRCSTSSRHTADTDDTDDTCSLATASTIHDYHQLYHPSNTMKNETSQDPASSFHHHGCAWSQQREKEYFILFTRVLVKHLESLQSSTMNDSDHSHEKNIDESPLHERVKAMIHDCVERNRNNEIGYESVTECVKERLEVMVPREHCEQAHRILRDQITKEQQRLRRNHVRGGGGGGRGRRPSLTSTNGSSPSASTNQSMQRHHHQYPNYAHRHEAQWRSAYRRSSI